MSVFSNTRVVVPAIICLVPVASVVVMARQSATDPVLVALDQAAESARNHGDQPLAFRDAAVRATKQFSDEAAHNLDFRMARAETVLLELAKDPKNKLTARERFVAYATAASPFGLQTQDGPARRAIIDLIIAEARRHPEWKSLAPDGYAYAVITNVALAFNGKNQQQLLETVSEIAENKDGRFSSSMQWSAQSWKATFLIELGRGGEAAQLQRAMEAQAPAMTRSSQGTDASADLYRARVKFGYPNADAATQQQFVAELQRVALEPRFSGDAASLHASFELIQILIAKQRVVEAAAWTKLLIARADAQAAALPVTDQQGRETRRQLKKSALWYFRDAHRLGLTEVSMWAANQIATLPGHAGSEREAEELAKWRAEMMR